MNAEKLRRLQSQVRIGGKGTPRRKKKVMHQSAATDDKKLQSSLKKLSVSTIPGIEEVNIIKDDLTVIHFNNPKAQASLSANTFAVTGHGETKKIVEMLPEILPQLGQDTVMQLRMFANTMSGNQTKQSNIAGTALENVTEEDEVPMLVNDFEEVAKMEETKSKTPKQKVEPKAEQDAAKNKEHDGTVPQNIAQKVDAPKVESTAKNAEKMDKKAKKQQNKQSANGAAKNKPESANNETKQKKNEKTNKQETISAVTVEKKVNETTPPIEKQEFQKKSEDALDAKKGEAVKEEPVKATTTTTHNQQTTPQSHKSAQKEDHKASQQKPKDDKTKNDNKSVQETKSETTKEALDDKKLSPALLKESSKPLELGDSLHCKDDHERTQSKNETPTDENAPKTPESTLIARNETQQGAQPKDLKVQQQTGGAVSPQPTDLKPQQAPKGASPQPKNASPQPKDHKTQPTAETKDINTQQTPKATLPQPKDQKAPPAPKGVSPQPKDVKAQTTLLQSNDQQTLKSPLPQSKDQKAPPTPKGVSPQPKDVKAQTAPKDATQQSNDLKAQSTIRDDSKQSMDSKSQQVPKGDLSSMDLKKDVPHQHLDAQQPRKSVSPQPKEITPKIDSSQPKELNAQPTLDQPKDLKAQPVPAKDITSSPPTDNKAAAPAKIDEAQKASEINIQIIPKDLKVIENKPVDVISDKKENQKQTGIAPAQMKIEDKISAPMDTNKIEKKTILEKPETENILVAELDTNIISTALSAKENKEQVKIASENKNETLPVAKKEEVIPPITQQQIPTAVIEKATLQIDEVIAAATKEVAKLPTTANQSADVAQVVPTESSTEIKSPGTPAGVVSMPKKDDTTAKPANVSATKPTNQAAQAKSGKSTTPKPNQQSKQTPAKTPDKPSNSAKPTNVQQKPIAPPTKKSPTNTPPTTPTEPTAVKIKEAKPDAQKKPTNQPAQKQAQTKLNTTKPSNSATKTTANSSPATGSGPKKTPPPPTPQNDNKQTKQATTPKSSENNAAKAKQTSPPKTDVKQSTKPMDESKPQQNTSPKSATNQPQATPKANP